MGQLKIEQKIVTYFNFNYQMYKENQYATICKNISKAKNLTYKSLALFAYY